MYRRPSKKRELIRRVLIYALMTSVVIIVVSGLVFVVLGYQLGQKGQLEQGALLQFASTPGGATVTVDGKVQSAHTPSKMTVLAGEHTIEMSRTGYDNWTKTLDIKAGTLTWINYIRLVPSTHPTVTVATYPTVYDSKAAADGRSLYIQQSGSTPTFQLVDISSDKIKTTAITVPAKDYTDATSVGVTHTFSIAELSGDGRYLLLQHTYNDKKEWLVVDSQNLDNTKNVTALFDLDISELHFAGDNGSILYALTGGDVRKLDLSASTVSSVLLANVSTFSLYNTNVITYIGTTTDGTKRVVGLYREGDSAPVILRTTNSGPDVPLTVATSHYFNEDYVTISEGAKVDITAGSYPTPGATNISSLKPFASFNLSFSPSKTSFSIGGDYLVMQSGKTFAGYDIEHQTLASSTLSTISPTATTTTLNSSLDWIDDSHLWSDDSGVVTMRDFDGTNVETFGPAVVGQMVTLSQDGNYLYSIGLTSTGYHLQRVHMVLQ
jgi:hypothetical protein